MEAPVRDIMDRVREGDTEAFGELVRIYRKPVYALVSGITGENDEADDLAQTCFLEAFRRRGELRDDDRFGSWLYAIARNKSRDWLRRRAQAPDLVGDPSMLSVRDHVELPTTPETEVLAKVDDGSINAVVRGLPAKYRTVVLLRCLGGLSFAEIADASHASRAAVEKRWHRARAMLRERLQCLTSREAGEGPQ